MLRPDFCNQPSIHVPAQRSISRAWGFRRHRPTPRAVASFSEATCRTAGAASPCGDATPGRCAFDDAHRASGPLLTSLRLFGRSAEHRSGRCSRAAAFSTACTVELRTPLTPSVAPRAGEPAYRARTVASDPSSKSSDPSRFRVPFIDECPTRVSLARNVEQGPPPIPRLCRRSPASRRFFARRCSRIFELDPLDSARVPPPESDRPRAVHRLMQPNRFASTAVDDPEPRAPRQRSPAVAAPVAGGCSIRTLTFRRIPCAANRDFTGQGSKWRRKRLSTTTPLDAIARGESFAPPR